MPEIFLTSGSSWQVPADCIKLDSVDCFGAGGSGALASYYVGNATGGGGGAFSRALNIPVTPLSFLSYNVGLGGAGQSWASDGGGANGIAGGDTYVSYNSAYVCYAQGGRGGNVSGPTTPGGAGGSASAGVGNLRYSGGRGGNASNNSQPTGGGGAAGPNGNGIDGTDVSSSANSAGGYGDAYAGGAGSAGVGNGQFNANYTSGPGGTGTELGSGYGCGGGSGSGKTAGSPGYYGISGQGGQFGGASGGAIGQSSGQGAQTGAGYQGFIVIRYTPVKRVPPFNMPIMGL